MIAFQNFAIIISMRQCGARRDAELCPSVTYIISIDISFKIYQFVCIKQAYIKFGYYLTFRFTF
jgi:hypothetical protein